MVKATSIPEASGTTATEPVGSNAEANEPGFAGLARHAANLAIAHRSAAASAAPRPSASPGELRTQFDIGLPLDGRAGCEVLDRLATAAEPGLVGNIGPDFYGWVIGASHPVGVAADWLTSAWGQNSAIYATSPAAAIAEEVVGRWLIELLRLPSASAVGFATGATMASFTCLAAARSEALRRVGYDLDSDGLIGAPPISVFVGEEAHTTIISGLRYLGFGRKNLVKIASDDAGRMRANDLEAKLARHSGPKIIVAQAGHINSGAFDPFIELTALAKRHDAWLHVDGAFGLWARAVPELDPLSEGVEFADSWAVDGHKWLQVPYESGFAIVKDEGALKRAMDTSASYIAEKPGDGRNPTQYGPELSRRARGFTVWAVLQALGRNGIAELVRNHCGLARHLASRLAHEPGVSILNEVVLNQLALAFEDPASSVDTDTLTGDVVTAIQKENRSFVEPAAWKGRRVMRVSIVSATTQTANIDRLAESIVRAWREVRASR